MAVVTALIGALHQRAQLSGCHRALQHADQIIQPTAPQYRVPDFRIPCSRHHPHCSPQPPFQTQSRRIPTFQPTPRPITESPASQPLNGTAPIPRIAAPDGKGVGVEVFGEGCVGLLRVKMYWGLWGWGSGNCRLAVWGWDVGEGGGITL